MKLVVIILLLVVVWLVYSILQSYRSMSDELRKIRLKCIKSTNDSYNDESEVDETDPANKMTKSLISVLSMVKNYST
jgi:hypothetical protein